MLRGLHVSVNMVFFLSLPQKKKKAVLGDSLAEGSPAPGRRRREKQVRIPTVVEVRGQNPPEPTLPCCLRERRMSTLHPHGCFLSSFVPRASRASSLQDLMLFATGLLHYPPAGLEGFVFPKN